MIGYSVEEFGDDVMVAIMMNYNGVNSVIDFIQREYADDELKILKRRAEVKNAVHRVEKTGCEDVGV